MRRYKYLILREKQVPWAWIKDTLNYNVEGFGATVTHLAIQQITYFGQTLIR